MAAGNTRAALREVWVKICCLDNALAALTEVVNNLSVGSGSASVYTDNNDGTITLDNGVVGAGNSSITMCNICVENVSVPIGAGDLTVAPPASTLANVLGYSESVVRLSGTEEVGINDRSGTNAAPVFALDGTPSVGGTHTLDVTYFGY